MIPKPEPLRVEHEQFRDAILGKPAAQVVTLAEGAEVVAVCEAMMVSDGAVVPVDMADPARPVSDYGQ